MHMGSIKRSAELDGSIGAQGEHTPRMRTVALAGNPNVGKSTLFNALTGLHQHTGNWTGKTVGCAEGICRWSEPPLRIIDLPGTYSLDAHSEEERVAGDFIRSGKADRIAVVCDATCLERNLIFVLQILSVTDRVTVCVNLLDEASNKGIRVDLAGLHDRLRVPVIGMSARSGQGLKEAVAEWTKTEEPTEAAFSPQGDAASLAKTAEQIAARVVSRDTDVRNASACKADRLLTGRRWGFPVMLLLLAVIFWLTVEGANLPSAWLSKGLFWIEERLHALFLAWHAPWWLRGALLSGVYRTVAWVVSVMLPPMAIFFPLFTILEDLGYLPRVAFNLDRCFQACNACGKQALTM